MQNIRIAAYKKLSVYLRMYINIRNLERYCLKNGIRLEMS